MPLAYLTRITRFATAHRYWRPEWSPEENARVFGLCANPHGHGHNYRLEVTVAGEIDAHTGYSVDLPALDAAIARQITTVLDHQHINHAVPEFRAGGLIPTSENMVAWCWTRLAGALPAGVRLTRMRLHEDETFYVDYFGGEAAS